MAPSRRKEFEKTLSAAEKQRFDEVYRRELAGHQRIIEDNILRDREHLRLVNFCTNPFLYRGVLGVETGYLFVRAEPLFELRTKHFDVAIYNKQSKVMLLIECKSSVVEVSREVDHVNDAVTETLANMKSLQDIVGDSFSTTEIVFCTNAAYGARVQEYITDKNLRICLWIADQGTNKLLLQPQGGNSVNEVTSGRLHGDGKLTRLLISGVDSTGVRHLPFLPSSHPCTLLVELLPFLDLKLRTGNLDRFRLSDVHTILKTSLLNISDEKLLELSELIVKRGLEAEIFHDSKPWENTMKDKEFEIMVKRGSVRAMVDDIREKYIESNSHDKAEQISIEKFKSGGMRETRPLEDFGVK